MSYSTGAELWTEVSWCKRLASTQLTKLWVLGQPFDTSDLFCWSCFLQTHALQAAPLGDAQLPSAISGNPGAVSPTPSQVLPCTPSLVLVCFPQSPMRARLSSRAAACVTEEGSPEGVCPREPELLTRLGVFSRPGQSFLTVSPCTSRLRDQPIKAKLSSSLFITMYLWLLRVPWAARRSSQTILMEINPIFIGRTEDEAEVPILWPPDVKNWLIGKDPDAGKDWRQEEEEAAEDEMIRIASLTRWTWTWANSGRQRRTSELQSLGLQRIRHNLVTEQQQWQSVTTPGSFSSVTDSCPPFISDTSQSRHSLPTETEHKRYRPSVSSQLWLCQFSLLSKLSGVNTEDLQRVARTSVGMCPNFRGYQACHLVNDYTGRHWHKHPLEF